MKILGFLSAALQAVLGFFQWLAARRLVESGRNKEKLKVLEKNAEVIDRVNRPVTDDERERLWRDNVLKFRRDMQRDTGAGLDKPD